MMDGISLPQRDDRLARERAFYDELVADGSKTHNLLGRFSTGYYEKGPRGRLWGPVWRAVELRDKMVLDYGSGDGHFTNLLARAGAHAYGIDISPRAIEKADALVPKQPDGYPRFLVGDAHCTPFPDNSFDYVVGNGALHHLDLDQAYGEVARLLKPGGKAIFQEPMCHHPLVWLLRRGTPSLRTDDEQPLSLEDLERAQKLFPACRHREHFLLAVCAAPIHLFGKDAALLVINEIDRLDQILMRALPPLRRFAWLTVVEWEK